jgi:hypothetical protein
MVLAWVRALTRVEACIGALASNDLRIGSDSRHIASAGETAPKDIV